MPVSVVAPPPTGNDILEKLQRHLGLWWFNENWLPPDMIVKGVSGSGSISWRCYDVLLMSGTTSLSYAYIYKYSFGLFGTPTWDKKRYFGVYAYLGTYSAQYTHVVSGFATPNASANTKPHIGFKLINADLYATVADGVAESTLLIETLTDVASRRLECILDPAVPECRFYVDGVDKGALTTNLPSGTSYAFYLLYASNYNTEAATKIFRIYSSRTFQEE